MKYTKYEFLQRLYKKLTNATGEKKRTLRRRIRRIQNEHYRAMKALETLSLIGMLEQMTYKPMEAATFKAIEKRVARLRQRLQSFIN